MELKNKLKELRTSHNMTQEAVAEQLGVTSQTVSKWERGLLSPDISLLPKIALLFKCSIDSLFNMEISWGPEHRREFETQIHVLHEKKDWEGVYRAWVREIELNPDYYGNYPDVMLHVLRKKMFDKEHIEKMISLADHAEKYCTNDDIRNEIYRIMLQICSESNDTKTKARAKYYYQKLPMLRHSREKYAKFVMEGEEYRTQLLKNIIYSIDGTECSVRQLILPNMSDEEKLFYYQKAAALYEVVLDDKYAGFYDPPLLYDYYEMAILYVKLGQAEKAGEYIDRICQILNRHMAESERGEKSKLLYATVIPNAVSPEQLCNKLIQMMLSAPELVPYREKVEILSQLGG